MVDAIKVTPDEDEVSLCVRYTSWYTWFLGIFWIVWSCVAIYSAYVLIPRAEYLPGIMGAIGGLGMLVFAFEILLTKRILFCEERVVKIWYFLGQRTIPYKKAMLMSAIPPKGIRRWMAHSYLLKEVDDRGKPILLQLPILYIARCVPREAAKEVDAIIGYLVGEKNIPRIHEVSLLFEKSTLSKEVL
jgi:hypothetical protein